MAVCPAAIKCPNIRLTCRKSRLFRPVFRPRQWMLAYSGSPCHPLSPPAGLLYIPPQKNFDDIGIAELLRFLPEGFTIPAQLAEIDIFEIDLKPPFEDLRSSQWPQSAA
jgi:hypothetical protein